MAETSAVLNSVAADGGWLVGEITGEGVDPTSRVAAMLRLALHFSYTTATDLALAGYDVRRYVELPAWLVTE